MNSGYNSTMETMFLIIGLLAVAAFQALIAWAVTRSRAYGEFKKVTIRLDELEGEIAQLSSRLVKSQKRMAAEKSVEAREDAQSLRDEATARLHQVVAPETGSGRPSAVLPFRKG